MEENKLDLVLVELKKIFNQIEKKFEQVDNTLDNMDKKISRIETDNHYDHSRIFNAVSCLNSAFLRLETEHTDKIDYLFNSDKERKEHKIIYAHEFSRLNDLVAKNSFRISNLEQHIN